MGVAAVLGGCAFFGGTDALAGAAIGLVLVAIFFLGGRLPFLVDAQIGSGAAFLFLGLNYLFRVVMLLVALVALRDQSWLNAKVTGLVVIFGALAWNALALRRYLAKDRAEIAADNAGNPEHTSAEEIAVIASGGGDR